MKLIHKRYEVIKPVGKGGSGNVYQVYDHCLQQIQAMKSVNLKGKKSLKDALYREIKIMSSLRHPRIPRVIDQFEEYGYMYVIMDFIDGVSLLTYIEDGKTITDKQLINWMQQIIHIFLYLHSHEVLYLDLKPQNIMLMNNKLYLIDFGCSCFIQEPHIYAATPGYAPEEISSFHTPCIQSDIYSFGITFFVLYHGHFPSEIKQIKAIDKVLLKCCQSDMEQRYQDFAVLQKALTKQKHKHSHMLIYALLCLIVFSLAALLGLWNCHDNQEMKRKKYEQLINAQQYEKAIQYDGSNIIAYEKMYDSKCTLEDVCEEAVVQLENLALETHHDHDSDIARFLTMKYMRLHTSSAYSKSAYYVSYIQPRNNHEELLLKKIAKLTSLLKQSSLNAKQYQQMKAILHSIIKESSQIVDIKQRFMYESEVLMLYDTYHLQLDDIEYMLCLASHMEKEIHEYPNLFHPHMKQYVMQRTALTYYYRGFQNYEKKHFDAMIRDYQNSIVIFEKTEFNDYIALLVEMQINSFHYSKQHNISYLEKADSYLSYMKDSDEKSYLYEHIQKEQRLNANV